MDVVKKMYMNAPTAEQLAKRAKRAKKRAISKGLTPMTRQPKQHTTAFVVTG